VASNTSETAPAGRDDQQVFLPLDPDMSTEELLRNLRINALAAHQVSMGQGDALVSILRRTVSQMEKTHGRVQLLSTVLFAAGLALIAAAGYQIVFRGVRDLWTALLGASGGAATFVATFWTAPVDKMSDSICDLVKLETAFLGYIRVIGEIDSAFQMQYLDTLAGIEKVELDRVIDLTTRQMQSATKNTLELIDRHVVARGDALRALQQGGTHTDERPRELETGKSKGSA
jgi:hypothetical protein